MKISVIAEGGAFRTAYVMGALNALYSHFGLKRVDYVAGSSISLGLLSYYILGRIHEAFAIVENYLSKSPAIGISNVIKRRPFVDVDYVIDKVLKINEPSLSDKLSNLETVFVIPVTDVKTGIVRYFTNHDGYDLFEVMRAGIAMPLAYNKAVKIGGGAYVDGGLVDPVPIGFPAVKQSKKIIILTKTEKEVKGWNPIERTLLKLLKWKMEPGLYKAFQNAGKVYRERMSEIKRLEEEGNIVIRPKKKMSRFGRNIRTIKKNAMHGYSAVASNEQVIELIGDLKKSLKRNFYFGQPLKT